MGDFTRLATSEDDVRCGGGGVSPDHTHLVVTPTRTPGAGAAGVDGGGGAGVGGVGGASGASAAAKGRGEDGGGGSDGGGAPTAPDVDPESAHGAAAKAEPPRKLNTLQLVMITFFAVCGGPFGLESVVRTAGPRNAILGLLVVPWVWALPQALMTAELSTALPEMGGYVVWVHRAFGDAAGFQIGVWKAVESLLDLALYPVLLVSYTEAFLHVTLSRLARWAVGCAIISLVSLINVLGAETVGDYSTVFGVVVLAPFMLLFVLGAHRIRLSALLAPPPEPLDDGAGADDPDGAGPAGAIDWGVYLAILLWNTSGFDSAGTCAAEVAQPDKSYLRAMVATLVLTVANYLLPLSVGVSVADDYAAWRTGHFVEVGYTVGGQWLAGWIAAAGAVSALALLTSLLCTSSRALVAFAELGMAPRALGRLHPQYGTPHVAVLANGALTSCLTLLDFEVIAEMAMCLYCLAMLAELLALAQLRAAEPRLPRPYRIPVGDTWGIRAFVASPCALCVALVAMSGRAASVLAVIVICATACAYAYWRRRGHGAAKHAAADAAAAAAADAADAAAVAGGRGWLGRAWRRAARCLCAPCALLCDTRGGGGGGAPYAAVRLSALVGGAGAHAAAEAEALVGARGADEEDEHAAHGEGGGAGSPAPRAPRLAG